MKENRMENEKISSLLISLALPAICAQLITLLYNIVDRIFIGQMENGVLAMAAIGICTPIVTIISAFTGLFGRGGSPLAAIHMGSHDREGAEKYLGNSFVMLIASSLLLMLIVFVWKRPILLLFGASERTLALANEYISIYMAGTIFIQLTVGMNYYITTQGYAKVAMMTTILGGILNTILDPIFIFRFSLGIRGAALATVIAQFISFLWAMHFLLGKRTQLSLNKQAIRIDPSILKEIIILGSAPFFMSVSEGVLNICFNNQVLRFGGDQAVGAMTILFSLFQFVLLPVEGVAQGSQPIISYNYGAGRMDRVKKTIKLSIVVTLSFTMAATTLIEAFPDLFIRIFNSDPALIEMGTPMLRIYAGGLFILGLNSTCQQTYNSLGEGGRAFFFAFYRKVILLIPLIYILPSLLPWGIFAVVLAEPISDLITTITNTIYFYFFIQKKCFDPLPKVLTFDLKS